MEWWKQQRMLWQQLGQQFDSIWEAAGWQRVVQETEAVVRKVRVVRASQLRCWLARVGRGCSRSFSPPACALPPLQTTRTEMAARQLRNDQQRLTTVKWTEGRKERTVQMERQCCGREE